MFCLLFVLICMMCLSLFKYVYNALPNIVFYRPFLCNGSVILSTICGDGLEMLSTFEYATVDQMAEILGILGGTGFNVGLLLLIFAVTQLMVFLELQNNRGDKRVGM